MLEILNKHLFKIIKMKKLILKWHKSSFQRYKLTCNMNCLAKLHKDCVININKGENWNNIKKIGLRVNSSELLNKSNKMYIIFYEALCSIGVQSVIQVKNKKSVGKKGYGNLVGTSNKLYLWTTLRQKKMFNFCYKWLFLTPGWQDQNIKNQLKIVSISTSINFKDFKKFKNLKTFEFYRLKWFKHIKNFDIMYVLSLKSKVKNDIFEVNQ